MAAKRLSVGNETASPTSKKKKKKKGGDRRIIYHSDSQ